MELNEMKKAYWREELARVTNRLAAERSRFMLAKESLFVAKKAMIGEDQKEVIAKLDDDLMELADDYALRVKAAVDTAVEESGFTPVIDRFAGIDITEQVAELESDFANDYNKVKRITGERE